MPLLPPERLDARSEIPGQQSHTVIGHSSARSSCEHERHGTWKVISLPMPPQCWQRQRSSSHSDWSCRLGGSEPTLIKIRAPNACPSRPQQTGQPDGDLVEGLLKPMQSLRNSGHGSYSPASGYSSGSRASNSFSDGGNPNSTDGTSTRIDSTHKTTQRPSASIRSSGTSISSRPNARHPTHRRCTESRIAWDVPSRGTMDSRLGEVR